MWSVEYCFKMASSNGKSKGTLFQLDAELQKLNKAIKWPVISTFQQRVQGAIVILFLLSSSGIGDHISLDQS
jgi:hypothetical protein